MIKLTEHQRSMLSAATKRADGAVFPLPKSLKLKGRALQTCLLALHKKGLLAEVPAPANVTAWREDKNGRRTLVLSETGYRAVGAKPGAKSQPSGLKKSKPKKPQWKQNPSSPPARLDCKQAPRQGSKQAVVLDLLRRDGGATVAELAHATGWQPHSVRGAISGTLKKKLELIITAEKSSRGRIYRIRQHD